MSSRTVHSLPLIADTIRAHRRSAIAWILGGSAAMYVIALGFTSEVAGFEGGAKAMAASLEAGAQAMRLLRWPPERLDTLGGYVAYHNVTLFVFFLSLYAAVKGVGDVRGAEARGSLDVILSTGRSRASVLRDRAVGFGVVLATISLGIGVGLAVSMAAGGEPDLSGSILTGIACGTTAMVAYGIGALVSQLTGTARSASAVTALMVTGLYLLANVGGQLGPVRAVRFLSPFSLFSESRPLVPGQGFSVYATLALVTMGVALLMMAAWAFDRRDVGAALWRRAPKPTKRLTRVQRPALRSLWSAMLVRERTSLVVWSAASAAGLGLMAWLEPSVVDVWDKLSFTRNMMEIDPTFSVSDQYLSFAGEMITPIVAAFVIAQAAGWVADLDQGRVEIILAGPVSWPGLIRQRLVALLVGVAVVVAGAMAGLVVGATAVGADLNWLGLLRLAATAFLLAAGLGALAALFVAWLRGGAAVTALALLVGGSYLLVVLVQLFGWPEWVTRVTVFGAFGHPYLEVPGVDGLAFLVALTAIAGVLAASVARRSPKTA